MATHISKSLVEMQNGNSNKRVISTAQSHCALAAVQCIVIGPVCLWLGVCVCVCVCLWVDVWLGMLPRELEIVCIDPHQTGFVGKGSDHLQLIKFWPSRVPGNGSAAGRKFLAPPYYSNLALFASL